jgi:L-seryl-tRNA(Ser) seleniumtransferase
VGQQKAIEQIRANPLTRALRIDKLTLAALEATLKLYRDEKTAVQKIPTLRMLTLSHDQTCQQADRLCDLIRRAVGDKVRVETADLESRPGGGSFPGLTLPSRCVTLQPVPISVAQLERALRKARPAIMGRIEADQYILDTRTLQPGQDQIIATTLKTVLKEK